MATVREKLCFPLKFEKSAFCLDFASAGGSATSDSEPTSLCQYRLRKRGGASTSSPNGGKSFATLKKKFSSAEKVKKNPFSARTRHGIANNALSRDSEIMSSSDSFKPLRLTVFHSGTDSQKLSSFDQGETTGSIKGSHLNFQPTANYTSSSFGSSEAHSQAIILNGSHQQTFMPTS